MIVRADDDRMTDAVRSVDRPLQRLHASERSADDDVEIAEAAFVECAPLLRHDIAHRDARFGERVDADDAPAGGIEKAAGTDQAGPPFGDPARPG